MPNQITVDGIQIKSVDDIVSDLTLAFSTIYAPDVDFSSNTPDGQLINNFAQQVEDELELTVQVYDSFDPDQAIGTTLDSRVALNGIKRLPGTYSTTDVSVTTSGAVTLQGLDGNIAPVGGEFIVADNAGTQWVLVNSFSIGSAGTTILVFRAVNLGAVQTTANTLTIPVTIVLGVISVNNPTSQLTTGDNEETDAALKIRRRKSVALTSVGFYAALIAALQNIPGVSVAAVYENDTNSTDADSIPAHSIWVIVGGSASDADIAAAIYSKRSAGCGMKGSITFAVPRIQGGTFTVAWDEVEAEALFIHFNADLITGNTVTTGNTHNGTAVLDGIPDTTGLQIGYLVRGTAVPAGATIVSVDSGVQVTISANCTGNHSAEALTFVPVVVPDLKTAIVSAFSAAVNQTLNINALATLIQGINPNLLLTSLGLSSDDSSFFNTLTPAAKNKQFTLATGGIHVL